LSPLVEQAKQLVIQDVYLGSPLMQVIVIFCHFDPEMQKPRLLSRGLRKSMMWLLSIACCPHAIRFAATPVRVAVSKGEAKSRSAHTRKDDTAAEQKKSRAT
jgi:hypothetical protein